MEPALSLEYYGPQHDDFRGAQFYYGDAYEPNDAPESARDLGALSVGQQVSPSDLSDVGVTLYPPAYVTPTALSHNADADYFRCSLNQATSLTVVAVPVGRRYDSTDGGANGCGSGGHIINSAAQTALEVEIFGSDGTTSIRSATAGTEGATVTLSGV